MGFLSDLNLQDVSDPFDFPDGKYQGWLFDATIQPYKDAEKGNALILTYKIDDPNQPDHKGKTIQEWFSISNVPSNTAQKKGFLKRRLESLGIPESRHNDVEVSDLIGLPVIFSKKRNGDYNNVTYVELRSGFQTPSANAVAQQMGGQIQEPAVPSGNVTGTPANLM
jgi:hypothetical protein